MIRTLWLLFPLLLTANEDFISPYEYGEMLYNNPRGVSCAQCHNDNGEGKDIVSYKHAGSMIVLKGSDIREKSLSEMIKAVNTYHKVMPRYYLTDKEVEVIFNYLKKKNNQE